MFAKRVFILSIAFLSCTTTSKKDDATAIRDLIDQFNDAYAIKNWNKLADAYHPRQFDFISRNDFIMGFNIVQKRKDFRPISNSLTIDSISGIIDDNEDKYSLVYVQEKTVSEFSTNDNLEELCKGFRSSPDFITCDVKGNQLVYVKKDKYYAVFLSASKKWFLLNPKEQTNEITDKIIPLKVRQLLPY